MQGMYVPGKVPGKVREVSVNVVIVPYVRKQTALLTLDWTETSETSSLSVKYLDLFCVRTIFGNLLTAFALRAAADIY